MAKIDALRRFFLPCFFPHTTTATATVTSATPKKRLSTSLRDDIETTTAATNTEIDKNQDQDSDQDSPATSPDSTISRITTTGAMAPPRPSKSMVIGTVFGNRRGHVWFCVQHDRLSTKPFLLLELPIMTHQLVNEMQFGLVRIALESSRVELELGPLRSLPIWAMSCNGRKLGFAARKKPDDRIRLMLRMMQSTTVGAGVIPSGFGCPDSEELMYMRANYEHVVGSADSESFHLINPDECHGQELSIFLLRSRNGASN